MFHDEQFVWKSANDLGDQAVDLDSIPRCSAMELDHPRCSLRAPDKSSPIRWVRSISLLDGSLTYVPVVMVYLHAGVKSASERFWIPISTGCAAHTSYTEAVLNGLLEVVERDAISIIWLQQLSLPRIDVDDIPPILEPYWSEYQRSSNDIEYLFFDATTDLGIPTVYGLQIARSDARVNTLVSCSTDVDPAVAVAKVIRDMCAIRHSFSVPNRIPTSFDDYKELFDGATFMARREQSHAFAFLLRSQQTRKLSQMRTIPDGNASQRLTTILDILRLKNLHAYAIDLSTDEALRVGFRVIRVLVPGLAPLSFHYRARYLGTRRIYTAPHAMGYPAFSEADLNTWPQPFA